MTASAPSLPAPGRRDPSARRQAIVAAAAELITGGEPFTHRAVAARAGVSLGSTTQYFSSIDDLRGAGFRLLADEIDAELAALEPHLSEIRTNPEAAARAIHGFLLDTRQIRADIALMHAGTTDPERRSLALRWFDRFIDLLALRLSREAALAIATYVDGATMHAGLHDDPLDIEQLTRAIRALTTIDAADAPGNAHS